MMMPDPRILTALPATRELPHFGAAHGWQEPTIWFILWFTLWFILGFVAGRLTRLIRGRQALDIRIVVRKENGMDTNTLAVGQAGACRVLAFDKDNAAVVIPLGATFLWTLTPGTLASLDNPTSENPVVTATAEGAETLGATLTLPSGKTLTGTKPLTITPVIQPPPPGDTIDHVTLVVDLIPATPAARLARA